MPPTNADAERPADAGTYARRDHRRPFGGSYCAERGTPTKYRKMHGFGVNTWMSYNDKGEHGCFKWHFSPARALGDLTAKEAVEIAERADHLAICSRPWG